MGRKQSQIHQRFDDVGLTFAVFTDKDILARLKFKI
jgi:hypothetical protein